MGDTGIIQHFWSNHRDLTWPGPPAICWGREPTFISRKSRSVKTALHELFESLLFGIRERPPSPQLVVGQHLSLERDVKTLPPAPRNKFKVCFKGYGICIICFLKSSPVYVDNDPQSFFPQQPHTATLGWCPNRYKALEQGLSCSYFGMMYQVSLILILVLSSAWGL